MFLSLLTKVVFGTGRLSRLPVCPVCPVDLIGCPIRVKRTLTDPHGKSDLPCPRWLPPGPPRRRAGGRRRVARRGRNGMYRMSGVDPMGDNGTAGVDRKDGRVWTPVVQTGMGAQTAVADMGMWA